MCRHRIDPIPPPIPPLTSSRQYIRQFVIESLPAATISKLTLTLRPTALSAASWCSCAFSSTCRARCQRPAVVTASSSEVVLDRTCREARPWTDGACVDCRRQTDHRSSAREAVRRAEAIERHGVGWWWACVRNRGSRTTSPLRVVSSGKRQTGRGEIGRESDGTEECLQDIDPGKNFKFRGIAICQDDGSRPAKVCHSGMEEGIGAV